MFTELINCLLTKKTVEVSQGRLVSWSLQESSAFSNLVSWQTNSLYIHLQFVYADDTLARNSLIRFLKEGRR